MLGPGNWGFDLLDPAGLGFSGEIITMVGQGGMLDAIWTGAGGNEVWGEGAVWGIWPYGESEGVREVERRELVGRLVEGALVGRGSVQEGWLGAQGVGEAGRFWEWMEGSGVEDRLYSPRLR